MAILQYAPRVVRRRSPKRFVVVALALLLAAVTVITGGGHAKADTGGGRISHVWYNFSLSGTVQQGSQYQGFIQSLRNAAGHYWTDGIYATQTNGSTTLIRVDLNFNGEELRLWIQPNDLYLLGFTNSHNDTYYFNDVPDLSETMQNLSRVSPDAGLLPPLTRITRLGYGSNYNSIAAAGGLRTGQLPMSLQELWNHAYTLQYSNDGQGSSVARALLFMIQLTSEAARFNDVAGVMTDITGNNQSHYPGLPIEQEELENHWQDISEWASNLYAGRNPAPVNAGPHAGTLSTKSDARWRLALALGDPTQVDPVGDWWHTEI